MSLTGKTKASSYKDILQMNNSNSGVDTSLRNVVDGEGTASVLGLSDDNIQIRPRNDDTTALINVRDKDGNSLLVVDSSNDLVKAGIGQHIVNTQYAYFGANYTTIDSFAANTHYPIAFSSASGGLTATNDVEFGTGTDPATTFTTSDTDTNYASQLVPMLWRVPDNITIDEIKHFEGADAATGDTTRMHLMSYTFNSGATGALTAGALVAHTTGDNTNAGNEQPYLKDWTIDITDGDIDAGKVLLCFFRSDSINSDYSVSVTIKYHLR